MGKTTAPADDASSPETEPGVAAVNRALSLLAAFSKEHPSFTLAQLSERTALYKSTILRLAESLEAFGYLKRSVTGVFSLGPTPMRLAALYQSNLHPAEVVMPVLRDLVQATTESAALYVRAGDRRLCAYRVASPRAISDNVQQGELLALDKGAGGRVLLAFDGAPGALYDEVRRTMFALTLGERDRDTAAVACPVFGPADALEGALSLSGPIQRFSPAMVKRMSSALYSAARTLTLGLGGDPDLYLQAQPTKGRPPLNKLLKSIRVLDLTNVLAGPFCGYQLALLGADVIKVEAPEGGDLARQLGADAALNEQLMGASFLAQNADKRSVVLDLKTTAGRAAFEALVATADVVLENYRPGVMDRLGLGYEALRHIRPSLIYCAISGFGQDGPLAKAPAYDQIIQGLSGLMSITGDAGSAPLRVGYPVCDTLGGITAAFAICAALVRRSVDGTGAFLDVSMLDSTLVSMGWAVSNLLIAGQAPVPMGNENFTASPSGTFETASGLLNIAANKQQQFEILCDLVGAPELKTDPRFAQREARKLHRVALRALLEKRLASADAATWEVRLNAAGVPAGQVLDLTGALAQSQVHHRELIATMPIALTDRANIQITRSGFRVDGENTGPLRPPPSLGQHTAEILREIGVEKSS